MAPTAALCPRRLDALLARRPVAAAFFAAVALAFTAPLFARPLHLGHGDWIWFHFIWDAARKSYVDFADIPWWNPYYCGGNLGVGNPNTFSLSPLFLLLLPLPTALAMKVFLATLTFFGLLGTYELCRDRGSKPAPAAVAALLFSCSGYMGWHMNGQTGMANLHLLPWVALCYLRGIERPRWALGAGLVLAFMLLDAGLYPAVISSVAIGCHALVTLEGRDLAHTARALRSLAIAGASAAAYAAVKLGPFVDFLRDHRREIASDDAIGLPVLVRSFFERRTTETQLWPHEGYAYAWWGEYGNYLGPLGVALCLVGLWYASPRLRRERLLAAISLAIAIGDHGSYSPYAVLRSLPMMRNLRVPTRYLIVLDLWLAVLAAHALTVLARRAVLRLDGRARAAALAALAAFSIALLCDLVHTNGIRVLAGAMPTPPAPAHLSPPPPFRQVQGAAWGMHRFLASNQGTLRCFDELMIAPSPALRADLPSEVYLTDPGAGAARITRFRPSTLSLEVTTTRPATVVLNQTFYRGWRVDEGSITSHQGLVAFDIGPGRHDLTLSYRPPLYLLFASITLGSLAATAALALRRRALAPRLCVAAGEVERHLPRRRPAPSPPPPLRRARLLRRLALGGLFALDGLLALDRGHRRRAPGAQHLALARRDRLGRRLAAHRRLDRSHLARLDARLAPREQPVDRPPHSPLGPAFRLDRERQLRDERRQLGPGPLDHRHLVVLTLLAEARRLPAPQADPERPRRLALVEAALAGALVCVFELGGLSPRLCSSPRHA